MKFEVLSVKVIQSKSGKTWYQPTIALNDGDTVQLFTDVPCKRGDTVQVELRKMNISGKDYIVAALPRSNG